jgi:hypothetical protein
LPSVQRFDLCIWKQWPVNRMLQITWWIISWFVTSDCITRFSSYLHHQNLCSKFMFLNHVNMEIAGPWDPSFENGWSVYIFSS